MSSTLSTVRFGPTVVDDSLPLVEQKAVVNSRNCNSDIDNNDVSLKSTVSSDTRVLGGYSISLLSNGNLAQQAGVFHSLTFF